MPYTKITDVDKQRIVDAYENHENYEETARVLGITRNTAYAIIRRYRRDGVISKPRGGAHNTKLDDEMIQTIIAIVEGHCEFTLQQINAELRLRHPNKPRICENSIATALNARLITMKLTRDVPTQRNTEAIKNERKDMANWMLLHSAVEKIYIDESGFRLWLKRSMGRSARGQRAFRVVDARGSQHVSVIFAVSSERGLMHHEFKEGGFNADAFKQFLECCSQHCSDRPIFFVFDNAPTHNSAHTSALQLGHSFKFLPHILHSLIYVREASASGKLLLSVSWPRFEMIFLPKNILRAWRQ